MNPLLPKLVVLKGDYGIARPLDDFRYIPRDIVTGGETLRFSLAIANVGRGPFEIQLENIRAENGQTLASAKQNIYNDDNTFESIEVDDLIREQHETHEAWHYRNFASFGLLNEDGQEISIGQKTGYCLVDVFRLPDPVLERIGVFNSPPIANFFFDIGCIRINLPTKIGISVGWADKYGGTIADQFIDISSIPSGVYSLYLEINKTKLVFEESSDSKQIVKMRINKEEEILEKKLEILS